MSFTSLRNWLVAANTTKNVAVWDRVVRLALGPAVFGLWLTGVLPTPAAIGAGVVAAMLLPTGITGACSIYYATGVSTLPAATDTDVIADATQTTAAKGIRPRG